jgi:hypothetical protein
MKWSKMFTLLAVLSLASSVFAFPLVFKRTSVVGEQLIPFRTQNNIPLLQGFEFSFDGNGVDNHIRSIGILPNSTRTGFALNYQDQGNDDRFSYKYNTYLIAAEGMSQHIVKGRCTNTCRVPIPANSGGIFALIGFQLKFIHGDRHIGRIGIEPYGDNTILVTMADREGKDPFDYEIHFTFLPLSRVSMAQISARNFAVPDFDRFWREPGIFIISGFYFEFPHTDNHLKTIGVYPESDSRIRVTFRDENGDDLFKWLVSWINLK